MDAPRIVLRSLLRRLQRANRLAARALCGLRGHNPLPHFEPGRVCLRCVDCGHETPGWKVGSPRLRA